MMIRAATHSVPPAVVQKALFASLALLITLLAGQQFEHWHAQNTAPATSYVADTGNHGYTLASNHLSTTALENTTALKMNNDNSNSIEQAVPAQVHQKSWIF